MILPNKNIILSNSLLGLGQIILENLNARETTSSLWSKVRGVKINSFEKFVLVLDFLYTLKLVDINNGMVHKNND